MELIKEAKQYLKDNWQKGVECPCCRQLVKLYKRPMHHSMLRMLINLYLLDRTKSDYYHLTQIIGELKLTGTTDFAILTYWGFIIRRKNTGGERGRTSGMWLITPKGKQFVENRISVPRKAKLMQELIAQKNIDKLRNHKEEFTPNEYFYVEEMIKRELAK